MEHSILHSILGSKHHHTDSNRFISIEVKQKVWLQCVKGESSVNDGLFPPIWALPKMCTSLLGN